MQKHRKYRVYVHDEFDPNLGPLKGKDKTSRLKSLGIFALSVILCWSLAKACTPEALAQEPLPTIQPLRAGVKAVEHDDTSVPFVTPVRATSPITELGLLLLDEPTKEERLVITRAIDGCKWTNRGIADPWMALALVRLEAQAGAPPGLLMGAWCIESGMRTGAIIGDEGRAIGPLQLHGWYERWCGEYGQRGELLWSAKCYLKRVLAFLPQAKAACPDNSWRVAEAWSANAPKYIPMGCKAESKHWKVRSTWRLGD